MGTLPGAQYATTAAFEKEVVARHGRDMWNFARYYSGGNETDADDAYQNALLAAYRYIGSFRGEAPLKHWLLRLVRTACLQLRRGVKNNHSLHIPIDAVAEERRWPALVSPDTPADIAAVVHEEDARLQAALGSIHPDDRELLIRHHLNGESVAKIARDLGLSVPCLKTRLYRARQAAREQMVKTSREQTRKEGNMNNGQQVLVEKLRTEGLFEETAVSQALSMPGDFFTNLGRLRPDKRGRLLHFYAQSLDPKTPGMDLDRMDSPDPDLAAFLPAKTALKLLALPFALKLQSAAAEVLTMAIADPNNREAVVEAVKKQERCQGQKILFDWRLSFPGQIDHAVRCLYELEAVELPPRASADGTKKICPPPMAQPPIDSKPVLTAPPAPKMEGDVLEEEPSEIVRTPVRGKNTKTKGENMRSTTDKNEELCEECHDEPIFNKMRRLCKKCYWKDRYRAKVKRNQGAHAKKTTVAKQPKTPKRAVSRLGEKQPPPAAAVQSDLIKELLAGSPFGEYLDKLKTELEEARKELVAWREVRAALARMPK